MKKILQNIPVTRILMFSYATLLIILVLVRSIEYKNLRKTNIILNELVNKSIHRQSTLTSMIKGSDYLRVHVLNYLYYPDKARKLEAEKKINSEISKNNHYRAAYQKLISDQAEQELFDRTQSFGVLNTNNRKKVFQLIKDGKFEDALSTDQNFLSRSYEDFQQAYVRLADFVNTRDAMKIKKVEIQLAAIENLNNLMNVAVIMLLIILGLIVGRTVKIMRAKNFLLTENERKYRTFIEQTNEIIESQDANGKFVFANNVFKKRLEYSDAELSNLTIFDVLTEESRRQYKPHPKKEETGEVITNVQKVFKSKSGKKIYIEGNILLEYKNGNFAGSMGFFKDITEKQQLKETLRASEEKFRNLFDLAPIPMWLFDPETYKFIQVNKAAIKHYGYDEEEFLNKTILDIRPENNLLKEEELLSKIKEEQIQLKQQGKVYRGNFKHLKKSKEVIEVEIYNTPILLNDKRDILTVAIDVTDRNHHEHRITKAIIKTQEDERYEIGSELHDNVCQILAAAKMSLGMMKSSLMPTAKGFYNQSKESIMLATEEIRNLSHRLAPAFFDNTTLEEAFESLFKTFNLENKYTISMYFDKVVRKYPINREIQLNLYRILQEQLRNIIRYANATTIEVDTLLHNNKLKMRIADNGIGFDIYEVRRGIGLANMKRRAELFSGTLEINSSPGNGCEIAITIPLHQNN